MLLKIQDDWLLGHIKDDPVRPHIPLAWRVTNGREVYGLMNELDIPRAMICVAYTNGTALTEQDLNNTNDPDTAMFYTVWSYEKGAGRDIVLQTAEHIKETRPDIKRYMTLSPLTEMAEKFHLRNGAEFYRKGESCQNFEYKFKETA